MNARSRQGRPRRGPARMTREQVIEFCASFPEAVEDYPFGDGVAVFKIGGRMFALVPRYEDPASINLKCEPDIAVELRARHAAVRPGYHQNKRHWNTVELDGSIVDDELREMIEHSYELVVGRLSGAPTTLTPNVDLLGEIG
jgi:predicted DNA-binding protein (MmcQ/YjbR family)